AGNHLGAGGGGAGAGVDSAERTRVIAGGQDASSDGPGDPGAFGPELRAHRAPAPPAAGPVAARPRGPVAAPPSGPDAAPPAGPGAAPSAPPATSISSSRARTLMRASTPARCSSTSQASSGACETPVGLRT